MAKTIGVLTSGGDAPGMNAAIRAVVRTALGKGMRVMGIYRGYNGLIKGDMAELNPRSVSDIIQRGGTVLYTARSTEFATEAGVEKAKQTCIEAGIDGLVVIGGDGSFRGARDLSNKGIPCIGIPATIDNDIASTDYTLGFDTAMNTCVEMIDKLRDTSQSHERTFVVEVMGRHAGHLALKVGIAAGATAIIVEEAKYDLDEIASRIKASQKIGKQHFIIIVSEGVGHAEEIAKQIEEKTGITSRASILGHVQRGGSPSLRDRVWASRMGYYAVELLEQGMSNRVVALNHNNLVNYDINEALNMKKPYEIELHKIAEKLSI